MNEVQLIRTQLATERSHATEVANACASALEAAGARAADQPALTEFCQVCVDYLVWVLTRFEQRDQVLADLFHSRLATNNEARRALDELLARPGKSRDALAHLEAALGSASQRTTGGTPGKRWREFMEFFNGVWRARRDAIDGLFERHARVADWRAVCAIDADSILEERARYAQVRGKLPSGIELRAGSADT
jgi:hypothetical protein